MLGSLLESLDKGASFWFRILLSWDTTAPFTVWLAAMLRVASASVFRFFTMVKWPSAKQIVVIWWRACPKKPFKKRTSAATSIEKNVKCSFLGAFCLDNIWPKLFAKTYCLICLFLLHFLLSLGPSPTISKSVNVNYTKLNLMLGIAEVLFVQLTERNLLKTLAKYLRHFLYPPVLSKNLEKGPIKPKNLYCWIFSIAMPWSKTKPIFLHLWRSKGWASVWEISLLYSFQE